jgi:hypothetical protein
MVDAERSGWERWFRRVLLVGWLLLAAMLAASQIDWSAIGGSEPEPPAPAPAPRPEPAPSAPSRPAVPAVRLELEFVAASWLEVEIDGRSIESGRVVPGGEILLFEGEERIAIRLGNAGGVRLSLDGRDLGPAGRSGEVVRRAFGPDGELAHGPRGSGRVDGPGPILAAHRSR